MHPRRGLTFIKFSAVYNCVFNELGLVRSGEDVSIGWG